MQELITFKSIKKFVDELQDEIIVFMDRENQVRAFTSVCPHMAGEINFCNNELVCKWHGLKFNESGSCYSFSGKVKLIQYQTFVSENMVYVQYDK